MSLLSILAATALAGCAADGESESARDSALEPPRPTLSAEGLELETSTRARAAGRYSHDGSAIRFDLTRAADGTQRIVVTSDVGVPIYESTLHDGIDESVYFGGRATSHGAVGEQPQKEGDVTAFDDLRAMPEAELMGRMKEALEAAGVSEALLRAPSASTGAVRPLVYGGGGSTPWPDNTWRLVSYGERIGFYSWGFWSTTAIRVERYGDPGGYNAVYVKPNLASGRYYGAYGQQTIYGQWAGDYVSVSPNLVALCSVDGSYCQNTQMWILVK